MSMWLNLAKVSPALLERIRSEPDVVPQLFFDAEPIDDFDPQCDLLGCDYRTLSAVADALANEAQPGSDWHRTFTWLSKATGQGDTEEIADVGFTYGGAFVIPAPDVIQVHAGLIAEGLAFDGLASEDSGEHDDDDEPSDDDPRYDDFVDLVPFFAAAAREGKAVVGGVS